MPFQKGHPDFVSPESRKKAGIKTSKKLKGRFIGNGFKKGHKDFRTKEGLKEMGKKISKIRKGIKLSDETKEKIRKARLKQVLPTKDTSIEIKLQNILKLNKIKFEKHKPILGQPDIFIEPNICIFADGDYWHIYPIGRDKDKRITKELQKQGYKVLRFWENEINSNIEKCYNSIIKKI